MNNYNRYTFKGKTKQGKWVYGYYVSEFNKKLKINKYFILNDEEENFIEIIPETLCQCTGLKDMEGNDIFENDIVSGYGNIFKATVEWNENFCGFYPFCNEETKIFADECKIISNKFDKEVE